MAIRYLEHATSPADDTLAFALINLQWCEPSFAERTFTVAYNRPDDPSETTGNAKRKFTFDEVEAAHPGLRDALIAIFPDPETASNIQAVTTNALAAYIFDMSVDLQLTGSVITKHPYVAKVFSAATSTGDIPFVIASSCFEVLEVSSQGIPKLDVRSYIVQNVSREQVESIWPGSSRTIPVMEALGYTAYQIGAHLNRSLNQAGPQLDVAVPDFDISVD